ASLAEAVAADPAIDKSRRNQGLYGFHGWRGRRGAGGEDERNLSRLLTGGHTSRMHAAKRIVLGVQFQHSPPFSWGTIANVGIEGPLENIDSSGALDLTFACELAAGWVANVKSAPLGR